MLPLVLAVAGAVVRVAVDASPGCADHDAFARALARHSEAVAVRDDGSGTIELRVRDSGEGQEAVEGVVHVAAAGRAPWQRTIRGRSCDEVTDALALIVAMSFDEEPPAPPPPSASPSESRDLPDRVTRPPEEGSRWRAAVGGNAGPLLLGTAALTLSYGGFAELELDRAGLAPSFRVGVTHAESSVEVGTLGAGLAWTAGRVDVCPLRHDFSSVLSFRPCAAVDLGELAAAPRGLANPRSGGRFWASTSITGRFRLLPERWFFVDGELGLTLPIVRDELAADPSVTLYRAPVVAPLLALSAGVRFP